MLETAQHDTLLQAYPVLRGLPPELGDRLPREGKRVSYPDGQLLFDLSSACEGYLLLLDGLLRVTTRADSGREMLLYRLFPGDSCIVTTCCLIGQNDYPVRASSEGDVAGVWISQAFFLDLLHSSPHFCQFIFESFAERLTSLLQLVDEVAFRRLDTRLARLLIERGAVIEATHQEIAAELGSVREIVSRLLKSFEEQGWVTLGRKQITVIDTASLREVAR